jgi:hypothetical protein
MGKNNARLSLGLRFSAKNLVTFDFPKQVVYLKQTNDDPLADETA